MLKKLKTLMRQGLSNFATLSVLLSALVLASPFMFVQEAYAGGIGTTDCSNCPSGLDGNTFSPMTNWIKNMLGGSLGKLIAFMALVIGGIYGAAKMSGMPMGAAFLIAIMLVFGVTILEKIIGATI